MRYSSQYLSLAERIVLGVLAHDDRLVSQESVTLRCAAALEERLQVAWFGTVQEGL